MKIILIACLFLGTTFAFAKISNPWSQVKAPSTAAPESIGEYSAGCLRGGGTLPIDGEGFQVMRLSRQRFYGHPALLDFLNYMGQTLKALTERDVLVGDLGQPRGGPTFSGHASHQSGLDVDMWYLQPAKGKILTLEEREKTGAPNMVVPEFVALNSNWKDEYVLHLKAAASHDQVERIFVNPVIKRRACEIGKKLFNDDGLWLGKLRPWWFHEDHYHVRLKCQPGSPQCVNQAAVPAGDGCGEELQGWFNNRSKQISRFYRTCKAGDVLRLDDGEKIVCSGPSMPKLPAACAPVLTEP